MRERHCCDEQRLELRFGGGLDLDDGACGCFELGSCLHRQQGADRAGTGCVADRSHGFDGRIGHQTEHECVERIDVGAERAGQSHVAERIDTGVTHQQIDAGAQRGLRQLDRAHVVLGDRQLDGVGAMQHVAERAIVGDDVRAGRRPSRRARRLRCR